MRKRIAVNVFILILILSYSSICFSDKGLDPKKQLEGYKGDGHIGLSSRDYGIGKTYGYMVQLQEFVAEKTITKTYSLRNLPIFDRVKIAEVELFTFFPSKPMPIEEINEIYQKLPESHTVKIKLYDSETGKIYYKVENKINTFNSSNARSSGYGGANFIKNLFTIEFDKIKSTQNLKIDFTYDIGNKPVTNKMLLAIIAEAPTA